MKTIHKPWGKEIIFIVNDHYACKILHIYHGHRLSKQYHQFKDETIYILNGVLTVELSSGWRRLTQGCTLHIRPNVVHRFEAPEGDCEIVEVSTPELSDVVRLEDDYGRT